MATKKEILDAVAKATDYCFDFEYIDILVDTIYSLDGNYDYEYIRSEIDYQLTYNKERWIVAKHFYSDPWEVNQYNAIQWMIEDIEKAIQYLKKEG